MDLFIAPPHPGGTPVAPPWRDAAGAPVRLAAWRGAPPVALYAAIGVEIVSSSVTSFFFQRK